MRKMLDCDQSDAQCVSAEARSVPELQERGVRYCDSLAANSRRLSSLECGCGKELRASCE